MNKILLFAGTTEGRHMAEFLNRHRLSAVVCAATEYGKCQILPGEYLDVRSERLNADEMVRLIQEEQICLVIDATHPYAVLVSENIRNACEQTETEYLRLLRPSGEIGEDCILVDSVAEAVEWLKASGERREAKNWRHLQKSRITGNGSLQGCFRPRRWWHTARNSGLTLAI